MKNVLASLVIIATLASVQALARDLNLSCTSLLVDSTIRVPYLLRTSRKVKKSQSPIIAKQLIFTGVGNRDVYNPTKPFVINGVRVMAARVEPTDSEHSEVMFFTEHNGVWSPLSGAPIFQMQDPFYTFINGELILGGVEIFAKPGGGYNYKTVFYKGRSLESLARFAEGPIGMKDIRLVELNDGRIGLFTRPQGKIAGTDTDGGKGKIGFTIIDSLQELNIEKINCAPLIIGQFNEAEWGGVNEAQSLPNGDLAIIGHVARFDSKGNRHYYPVVFKIDLKTQTVSQFKIILERKDLPGGLLGGSKRNDLRDVIFSGGFELNGDTVTIYIGAGDKQTYVVTLDTPFATR